jgi:peptidoglycan/LPS O-acetylase OafA/YrhL
MGSQLTPSTQLESAIPTRSTSDQKPKRSPLRGDIQGLRMLAVFAVIFDHMMKWPSGGFVGVDVFFVISGFLITGILLREHEKTHHISFVNFYQRRVKRIMPVATIVLILTVATAFFLFNTARYMQTFWDAVWAFFFAANWHFALVGTDYFQADGPVSPLQHFWSLSVEEQFYFVWPWIMLGVLALAGRGGRAIRRRATTGAIMLLIVAVSFIWAMQQSTSNPTVAYFSTFTRAWELGIGALIAISSPWWGKLPAWLRPILGWLGFLGIVASYFVINDTLPFPAPWAMMPVLATALVIIAGTGGEQRHLYPLTNPVSKYLGDISYSLYLWHFPIIIFAGTLVVDPNLWIYYPSLLAGIILISVFSYHLLERPIQQMPFWIGAASSRVRKASWATWREKFALTYKLGGLSVLAATVGVLALGAFAYDAGNRADAASAAAESVLDSPLSTSPQSTSGTTDGPALTSLKVEISDSLKSKSWPLFDPPIDKVLAPRYYAKSDWNQCTSAGSSLAMSNCSWNVAGSQKRVLLVGDSTAATYIEAFRALAPAAGWSFFTRATIGCPIIQFETRNCPGGDLARRDETIRLIKDSKPDILVVTNSYTHTDTSGKSIPLDVRESALETFIKDISSSVGKVVILPPSPYGPNIGECYTPSSKPSSCLTDAGGQGASSKADRLTGEKLGATFADTTPLFCLSGKCPAFVGSLVVRTDASHLTPEYSAHIGPALLELLNAAGVK